MNEEFGQIRLRDLYFFERLAVLGTITATAIELGIPKPTASRWLAVLEDHVGHSLVHRTTRHLSLTERGEVFRQYVREILDRVRAAELATQSQEPSGTIRVSVPVPLGRLVGGRVIAAFRSDLPQVRLEVELQNRRVDLMRDRFDVAIRGGPLPDSDLIARKLADVPMWLYASAALSDTPVKDLSIIAAPGDEALLSRCHEDVSAPVVVVDDRTAVADALVFGSGGGVLPAFLGEPAVRKGELVRVDSQPLASMPVHAVYLPSQRDDVRIGTLIQAVEVELRRAFAGEG